MRKDTFIQTGSDYMLFRNLIKSRKALILSDENIYRLYPQMFEGLDYILLKQGEVHKDLHEIQIILEEFTRLNLDRKSIVIGVGGGIVTDMTGFAASVYMRGVDFGFVPTSLLAQVDAAIGGKNGVNFLNFKNYIGTFTQPEFVICDSKFFETLSDIEFKSGLGEVFKYSLLSHGMKLFDYLSENHKSILNRDMNKLNYIVNECVDTKIAIVEQDPFDHGIRNTLNLGHTFGHCIELSEKMPHGIAVVTGIKMAADLSVKMGFLKPDKRDKVFELSEKFGFDEKVKLTDKHIDILLRDKKKEDGLIKFILMTDIGITKIKRLDQSQIRELI